MEVKTIAAVFLPAILLVLFARVTYNLYVATALTLLLIAVSVYKGSADYPLIILIDLLSAAIGFIYAKSMLAAGK
ncbi:DUF2198 family protein [Priestia megaterium]|uniref:DUF2198 family protein n=1 Tax=Priestia megaterium TaxID=1404 RepID=UPI000BED5F0D|nr:DUF2198 family protein [Priestia megaterium]MDW4510450.1 DUF2198 family protein [Priestia megaterium]PEC42851.1 protein CsbA [Priestia megaterium]